MYKYRTYSIPLPGNIALFEKSLVSTGYLKVIIRQTNSTRISVGLQLVHELFVHIHPICSFGNILFPCHRYMEKFKRLYISVLDNNRFSFILAFMIGQISITHRLETIFRRQIRIVLVFWQ